MLGFGYLYGFSRRPGLGGFLDIAFKWLLDLARQTSTFTCSSVRNVWGYNGLPSASNSPQLISVPADIEAIEGGVWDGSKFTIPDSIHPFTLVNTPSGVVKKLTAFREYNTADYPYTAGDQVSICSSEGITLYMTAQNTASGSGTLPCPDFADIGTTISDDALNWYVNGMATVKGTLLEDASTNVSLQSRTPTAAAGWTIQNPATTTTQDLVGADGASNTGWTIHLDALGGLFSPTGTVTASQRYEPSVVLKQISTSGTIRLTDAFFGAANGDWHIDVSKLKTYWETVDRNHPAVTVVAEFTSQSTQQAIFFRSTAGNFDVGYYNCNVELGEISTSQIETAASSVTRTATTLSDTTSGRLTASSGAGRIVVTPSGAGQGSVFAFGTLVDANNYTQIFISSTTVHLRKVVSGSLVANASHSYTHSTEPMQIDFYYDSSGTHCRAFSVGDTAPSFTTDADTTNAQLGSTFELMSQNGTGRFDSAVISCELATNKEDFGW